VPPISGSNGIDLAIVGAGAGGVIALYYAIQAGLQTVVLERQHTVGGLWAQLPSWQDIQNKAEDWTLGDIPIAGVDQAAILANIRQWVERFDLAEHIRLGCPVISAAPAGNGWDIETTAGKIRAKALIGATGVHNRPYVPAIRRSESVVAEFHSSALRDPAILSGKQVVVVGGGASAFDLIDLGLEYRAAQIWWVHRALKWMVPTAKPKAFASNLRELGKRQMLGQTGAQYRAAVDAELRARYRKFGMQDLLPDAPFDFERDQLIPGRWRLIAGLGQIRRHRDEIEAIQARSVVLRSGTTIDADVVLWGTGYDTDLAYLRPVGLHQIDRPDQLARRCGSMVMSLDAPNLYFISVGLESTSATPWHYAHLARTIVSQIRGSARLSREPVVRHLNFFGVPAYLAQFDPENYPADKWRDQYLSLVSEYPIEQPLPLPTAFSA
jgi:cation diffusion facilitator CzcD-associated flavoprotein CzcO